METWWCLLDNSQPWWVWSEHENKHLACTLTLLHESMKIYSLSGNKTHVPMQSNAHRFTTYLEPTLTQTSHFTVYWKALLLAVHGFASMCKNNNNPNNIENSTGIWFPMWENDRGSDLPKRPRHHIFFNNIRVGNGKDDQMLWTQTLSTAVSAWTYFTDWVCSLEQRCKTHLNTIFVVILTMPLCDLYYMTYFMHINEWHIHI